MGGQLEIETLKRQVFGLRQQMHRQEELLATIASPPWKRLWWFIQGYRLWSVGRWYRQTDDLKSENGDDALR
ncbi:MAG: hypothetical protein AABN33_18370 [Acidobacteriota bacterium]